MINDEFFNLGDEDINSDYFQLENQTVKNSFNLDEILEFQLKHDVQIIRGEDYQYMCYIDRDAYGTALTPMYALYYGIQQFNLLNKTINKIEVIVCKNYGNDNIDDGNHKYDMERCRCCEHYLFQ